MAITLNKLKITNLGERKARLPYMGQPYQDPALNLIR